MKSNRLENQISSSQTKATAVFFCLGNVAFFGNAACLLYAVYLHACTDHHWPKGRHILWASVQPSFAFGSSCFSFLSQMLKFPWPKATSIYITYHTQKSPKSEDKDLLSSSAPFARHILVLFCWGKNVLAGELSQDYRMGKDEKHVAKLFYEKHASIEGEKAPWSSVPCICHHALCLPGQHAQIHRDQVDPYIGKSGTSKLTKFHFNMLFQTLAHMID